MRYFSVIILLALAGCGIKTSNTNAVAMQEMMASKQTYKECLARKSSCTTEKAAYEADLAAYTATADALNHVGSRKDNH